MNIRVKFKFKQKGEKNNRSGLDCVCKSHPATSHLLWFINVPTLNLLPLTPCWILNEICMADARQQDVKEEAWGTLGKVKGRSFHRQESWSRLKGRLGWTPSWNNTLWGRQNVMDSSEEKEWFTLRKLSSNQNKKNKYLKWKRLIELIQKYIF